MIRALFLSPYRLPEYIVESIIGNKIIQSD